MTSSPDGAQDLNGAPSDSSTAIVSASLEHTTQPPHNSYDAVPYSVHAFAQTRPDRLATIATLFGMSPASPDRCRVLELGCASGGNLIPMGLSWPDSQFVGIDFSARQIQDGQDVLQRLALKNVELQCLSILDISPQDIGTFDYILCHGVYSWVPPEVQDKILLLCRDLLNPSGVAYISYNTFPGWHARAAIREMLCYHTEQFEDPADRIREARGLLTFLASSAGGHDAAYNSMVRQELAVLAITPDSYLLHEHLEDYNEPLYFHQFVDRAAEKNLQYLGEALITAMLASRLGPPEVEKTLRRIAPDLVHMEQYMDFLRNRMFRQTLLCHDHVTLDYTLRSERVQRMYVTSAAKPKSEKPDANTDAPEQFSASGSPHTLTTRDPLMKAAMMHLSRLWPESITFDELLDISMAQASLYSSARSGERLMLLRTDQSRHLATRLLHCYTSGLVEFSLSPPRFVARVSERPVASPYARLRASEGAKVVNMRLESTTLNDPMSQVLQRLDGQHDRASLVAWMQGWIAEKISNESPPPAPNAAEQYVDQLLHNFAQAALLIG